MKIPTWKIVVYFQLYQHHPGKHKSIIVEAHPGMEAVSVQFAEHCDIWWLLAGGAWLST